jgi:hypothetical protein
MTSAPSRERPAGSTSTDEARAFLAPPERMIPDDWVQQRSEFVTRNLQVLTAIVLRYAITDSVAGILKCVDNEDNIFFSDVACPQNPDRQYIPAYKSDADYYRQAKPAALAA